jgi:uncharacterized protein YndB with AHSA1/START domain
MKAIRQVLTVPAPTGEVWDRWTTEAGVQTFFAPKARISLWPGGAYELLFRPNEPEGARGSEGCRVLSFQPGAMLSFDWNAPPEFAVVRQQRTWVVVLFQRVSEVEARVTLTHLGWGAGPEWDAAYRYFQRSWSLVFDRLEYAFREGPVDWDRLSLGATR